MVIQREFGHQNLSRKQSIATIQRTSSMRELVLLMNPNHDKFFGWNFLYHLNSPHNIEFRRGAASTPAQQIFVYIEVAMSFVETTIRLGSSERLEKVPTTVGDLRWFIQAANLPDNVPGHTTRDILLCFLGARVIMYPASQNHWEIFQPNLEKLQKRKTKRTSL